MEGVWVRLGEMGSFMGWEFGRGSFCGEFGVGKCEYGREKWLWGGVFGVM